MNESADGNLYATDQGGVWRIYTQGPQTGRADDYQPPLYQPSTNSSAFAPDGTLWLSNGGGLFYRLLPR